MRTTIEYYCKFCKGENLMRVSGPVKHLNIYWLKCSRCKNNWRVPAEEVEKLAKTGSL